MPDIACKAIFVVHLPPGFLILLLEVHGAGLGIYFLKFLRPQPSVSSSQSAAPLTALRLLGSLQAREGGGGLCSLQTTLPWEFPVAVSHGRAPSAGWKRRHPPSRALAEREKRARNAAPGAHQRPGARQLRSRGSPSSGPAAESPDVGFNPYAGSFISIKGQRHGGAEITAADGAPASPALLALPPRAAPPPARESARPRPRVRPQGTRGEGRGG